MRDRHLKFHEDRDNLFSAHGTEHQAMAAQGIEELGRSGVGVGDSGASYASGDALAASSYLIARG